MCVHMHVCMWEVADVQEAKGLKKKTKIRIKYAERNYYSGCDKSKIKNTAGRKGHDTVDSFSMERVER